MIDSGFGIILGVFLGICLLSSLLVVVHILTDGRSKTPQSNVAPTQTQSTQDSKAVVTPETQHVPLEPSTFTDKQPISQRTAGNKRPRTSIPIITSITGFVSKIGINRVQKQPTEDRDPSTILMTTPATEKDSTFPEQHPYDKGLALQNQFPPPSPNITGPEIEIDPISISPEQEVPYVDTINEEPKANLTDTLAVEEDKPVQDSRQEESELIEDEVEGIDDIEEAADIEDTAEADETIENEQEEQPATQDSVFSLFSEEVVEENDVTKIAVDLEDIDAHSLSEEVHDLISQFRNL